MKKILLVIFLFSYLIILADDTKPVGGSFKLLPTYSFSVNNGDSIIWMYGGNGRWFEFDYKSPWYAKMVINSDTVIVPVHKKDTLNLTVFKLFKDSVVASGYASNFRLKFKIDSIMSLVYTKHITDSLLLLKVDKIIDHSLIRNSLRDSIPTALFKKDSTLYVTPYRLLQSLPVGYELEITTAGVTILSLPFTLSDRTLVFYNGSVLSKNLWSGVGISTLTLMLDTKLKDLLKIQNQ